MKRLLEYIIESQEITTLNNNQRKKELEKWLKNKKYDDYVDTLNKMLKDPKAKTLLVDGFGGDLGDTKLKFSVQEIPAINLIPTQNEIDLDKSILHALKRKTSFISTFNKPVIISKPVITFRKNYIIDGHHSWLQTIALNPNGKLLCFNYDGDISPIQMLKVVQGTIAAVQAETNKNQLPSNDTDGPNIFDDKFKKQDMAKYIEDNFNEELLDVYKEYLKLNNLNEVKSFLVEQLLNVRNNNYPILNAPDRIDMPQTFKGGTNLNDKNTAQPDFKGSALNKLKDDKFYKTTIK